MTEPTHVSGTIKPLVWEDADEGMCTKWRAAALGGHYELVSFDKEPGFAVNFSWGRPLSYWFIQGDPDEWGPTGPKMFPTLDAAKSAAQADCDARIAAQIQPDAEAHDRRSFPEAADGRPLPPMGDDLMIAGLSADDARFIALQLAKNGLILAREAQPIASGEAKLIDLLQWVYNTLLEINPSNYNHDEVCRLNDASVEAILAIKATLDAHKTSIHDPQPALSDTDAPQASQSGDLVSMEAAIAVAKEAISKIVYDQWFKSHYPVTSHGHQYVGEAAEAAIRALPAARAEVSVAEAARVLLNSAEFQHLLCEHEAGLDETVAALRALTETGE